MKTLLTILCALLAAAALAQSSLTLPGLGTTLSKDMTAAQVEAAFPGQTFERDTELLEADERWALDVESGDYSYILYLDFYDGMLNTVIFAPVDDAATATWVDGLVAALPAGTEHNHIDGEDGTGEVDMWHGPQYRIIRESAYDELFDMTLTSYSFTFK